MRDEHDEWLGPDRHWTLALAGDTMLGRDVAGALATKRPQDLIHPAIVENTRSADVFVLNLECCVSERGDPWPDSAKPFFFRAPPAAVELLLHLGVDAVSLANNHALDFGRTALLDTFHHLDSVGISWGGAGRNIVEARSPVSLEVPGQRVRLVCVSDHPADYAASDDEPGIAFAPLNSGVPAWLSRTVAEVDADVVVVSPHWGPNMTTEPRPFVLQSAAQLRDAGATLIAGHSAHVFHGIAEGVLFDLGDFIDDYAIDPVLRNDLGLLFLVRFEGATPTSVDALPLKLDYCYTQPAQDEDARWIERRLRGACHLLGTSVTREEALLRVEF